MSSMSGEIDFSRAIKILKENLIAVFDSSNANFVTGFTNRVNSNLSGGLYNVFGKIRKLNAKSLSTLNLRSLITGETMGMVTFGCGANCLSIPSLQTATLLCGGMSTLLFLFAKVRCTITFS